tara:strand:- start:1071 stop:1370 length:300 start_codon:yes stop_codon:yes gene_type:complete
MKKILITLSLIGLTYQSQAQISNTLFEMCYYPKMDINEFSDVIIFTCIAIVPIDNDSTKTMTNWYNSDTHKKLEKNSDLIILTYCPDVYSLPTKKYKVK